MMQPSVHFFDKIERNKKTYMLGDLVKSLIPSSKTGKGKVKTLFHVKQSPSKHYFFFPPFGFGLFLHQPSDFYSMVQKKTAHCKNAEKTHDTHIRYEHATSHFRSIFIAIIVPSDFYKNHVPRVSLLCIISRLSFKANYEGREVLCASYLCCRVRFSVLFPLCLRSDYLFSSLFVLCFHFVVRFHPCCFIATFCAVSRLPFPSVPICVVNCFFILKGYIRQREEGSRSIRFAFVPL